MSQGMTGELNALSEFTKTKDAHSPTHSSYVTKKKKKTESHNSLLP